MPKYSRPQAALRKWKAEFFKIRDGRAKVHAVNQLVAFTYEMRGYWPDTRLLRSEYPADLLKIKKLELPPDAWGPDKKLMFPTPEKIPVPLAVPPHASQEDPPVVGDVFAAEDTPEPVIVTAAVEGANLSPPAPVIPFGPDEVEVSVYGLCPNPRLMRGKTADGQDVSVWKGPRNWRLPQTVLCKRNPGEQILTPI